MTDARAEKIEVSVYDLCRALQPWFRRVVNQAMGKPDESYVGNAYWMEAAASVWLNVKDEQELEALRQTDVSDSNAHA